MSIRLLGSVFSKSPLRGDLEGLFWSSRVFGWASVGAELLQQLNPLLNWRVSGK